MEEEGFIYRNMISLMGLPPLWSLLLYEWQRGNDLMFGEFMECSPGSGGLSLDPNRAQMNWIELLQKPSYRDMRNFLDSLDGVEFSVISTFYHRYLSQLTSQVRESHN